MFLFDHLFIIKWWQYRSKEMRVTETNFQCRTESAKFIKVQKESNTYGIYHNYWTVMYSENSHRHCVNKWAWLCTNKALLTKTAGEPYLARGLCCAALWSTCLGNIISKIIFVWFPYLKNMIFSTMNKCSSFEFLFLPDVTQSHFLGIFLFKKSSLCWQLSWQAWMWRQELAWKWYFPNFGKCL